MLFSAIDFESLLWMHQEIDDRNEPLVFVFAGNMDKFKENIFSIFSGAFSELSCFNRICSLPCHEVTVYSVVLVGHQADINRILKDVVLQQQAWTTAYPGTCPKCDGPMLSILFKCGEWQCRTICKNCGTLYHVFNGKISVYDTKFLSVISIDPEADFAMTTGPFSRKETEYVV